MVRISNSIVGIINCVTLLVSLPIIGAGLWFLFNPANQCEEFLNLPLISLGSFLFLISVIGLVGACGGPRPLQWLYLLVLYLFIVSVFAFAVFAFVVLNNGVGRATSRVGFKEYNLSAYSDLMQKVVADWETWEDIAGCLRDAMVCSRSGGGGGFEDLLEDKEEEFYKKNLSPLESGCCKPPMSCGFEFKNATFRKAPKSVPKSTDEDCKLWSNEKDKLCYGCSSCKAGVIATMKSKWKQVSIFNLSLLIFLIILYSLGCCAMRNNRFRKNYNHGRP